MTIIQENLRIAQAYVDSVNAHDRDAMGQNLADDLKVEVATGAHCPMTKSEFLAYNENYINAFPDVRFDITFTVSEGAFIVLHWNVSGTHTETLTSPKGGIIVPTGKKATASGCSTFEIRNGKITRAWIIWDMATLLAQLGLLSTI